MPLKSKVFNQKLKEDQEKEKQKKKAPIATAKQSAEAIKQSVGGKSVSEKARYTDTATKGKPLPKRVQADYGNTTKGRGITKQEIKSGKEGANRWLDSINESTRSKDAGSQFVPKTSSETTTKFSGHRNQSGLDKTNRRENERQMTPERAEEMAWQWSTNPTAKFIGNATLSTLDYTPIGVMNSVATGNSFKGNVINNAPYGQEFGRGTSAKLGSLAGTMMGYGLTSGAVMGSKTGLEAQQAVLNGTKLGQKIQSSSIVGKIGQFANKDVQAIAQDRVRDALSNIAVGVPTNFGVNYAQGLRGKDLAKQMAIDTGADFLFDTGFNVASDVVGKIGKEIKLGKLNNLDISSGLKKAESKQSYINDLLNTADKIMKDREIDADTRVRDASVSSAIKYLDEINKVRGMTDSQFARYKEGLDPLETPKYNAVRGPKNQPNTAVETSEKTINATNNQTYSTTSQRETAKNRLKKAKEARETNTSLYGKAKEKYLGRTPDFASENEIKKAINAIQEERISSGLPIIKDSEELTDAIINRTGKDTDTTDVMRVYEKMASTSAEEKTSIRNALEEELTRNQQYEISRFSDVEKEVADSFPNATKEERDALENAMRNEDATAYREAERRYNDRIETERQAQADKYTQEKNAGKAETVKAEETQPIKNDDVQYAKAEAKQENAEPVEKPRKTNKTKQKTEVKETSSKENAQPKYTKSEDGAIKPHSKATSKELNDIAKENDIHVPQQVSIKKEKGKGGADKAVRKNPTNAQIREAIENNYKAGEADLNLMEYQKLLSDDEITSKDILDKYISDRKNIGSEIRKAELESLKELDKDALYNAIEARTLKVNGVKTFDDLADLIQIERRGWAGETSQNKSTKVDGSNSKRGGVTSSDVATLKIGDSITVPTVVEELGDIQQLKEGDYLVHNKHGVVQFQSIGKDRAIAKSLDLDRDTEFLKVTQKNGDTITIPVDKAEKFLKKYAGDDTPELGSMFDRSDVVTSMNSGVEDHITRVMHDKYGTETLSHDTYSSSKNTTKRLPKKLEREQAIRKLERRAEKSGKISSEDIGKTKVETTADFSKASRTTNSNTTNNKNANNNLGKKVKASWDSRTIRNQFGGKTTMRADSRHSRAMETLGNADITPAELQSLMKKNNDRFLKETITHKSILEDAEKRASENFDEMNSAFFNNSRSARQTTSQDIADGYVLASKFIDDGDLDKALDVYAEISSMESEVGRSLKAMQLFSKLTPEGRLRSAFRSVERLQKTRGIDIDLNGARDILQRMYDAKTVGEQLKANKEFATYIWKQIPATFVEKANAWRYLSMLGNPKTHLRNVLGNALFMPARTVSDIVASGVEKAFTKRLEKAGTKGTHAVLNPFNADDKALKKFASNKFKEVREMMEASTSKYYDRARPSDLPTFKTRVLQKLEKANNFGLEKEDEWFMGLNYNSAFAQWCKAKGLKVSDLTEEMIEEASSYAQQEALKATYRDANALADALNQFRRKVTPKKTDKGMTKLGKTIAGGVFDSTVPFVKTPLNILKRGAMEYSPIGLLRSLKGLAFAKDADELLKSIEYFSNGLTGTGLAVLGGFLANKGIVNGSLGDWDDRVAYEKMLGKQDYSVTLDDFLGGDRTISLDWIAPMSMPFFVGVEAYKHLIDTNDDLLNKSGALLGAFSNITEPIFEMSMLQGVENNFKTAFSEDTGIADIVKNSAFNYASQFVPTALGQLSRTIADERQVAVSTADDATIRGIEKQVAKIVNKIPRSDEWSQNGNIQDYVDQWGRTDDGGGTGWRAFENFVSPAYIQDKNVTEVDTEIERLYNELGEEDKNDVIPKFTSSAFRQSFLDKEYLMTPSEFTEYKKTVGQAKFNGLTELFKTQKYKDASNEEKAKMIQAVYKEANAKGKDEYLRKVDKEYASAPEFYQLPESTREKYSSTLGVQKNTWAKAVNAKNEANKAKEDETGKGIKSEEARIILLDNGITSYKQAQSILGEDTSKDYWKYAVEQHEQGVTYETLQKEAKECPNFYNLSTSQKQKWNKDIGVAKEVWGTAYKALNDANKKKKKATGRGLNSEEEMILLKEHGIKTLSQARTIDGNIGKTFLIFDNDSEGAWSDMVKAVKNGKTFEEASKEGYASAIKRNQAEKHVKAIGIPEKYQSKATTAMVNYDGKTVKQNVYDNYIRQAFYNNDNNPDVSKRNQTLDTKEIKGAIEKMDKKYGLTQAQKAYMFSALAPSNYKNPYN